LNISSAFSRDIKTHSLSEEEWSDDNNADNFDLYPTSPEEFGVLAFRLSRERELRRAFTSSQVIYSSGNIALEDQEGSLLHRSKHGSFTHGSQLLTFLKTLRNSYS
jgi:hypothetical protein